MPRRRRTSNLRPGVLLLALGIALFLWGIAHGSSDVERPYDVPVELAGLDDGLVVTELQPDAINVRIRGSRAALRNLKAGDLYYRLDVSGSKRGTAEHEVDTSRVEQLLPRRARIVSRSPSQIQVRIERKGHKTVGVRADVEGEPAEGYRIASIEVEPRRVRLAGARREVRRLSEVVTEPVDVSGSVADVDREVRLFLAGDAVWMEDPQPVRVRVVVEPDPETLAAEGEGAEGETAPEGAEDGRDAG